MGEEIGMPPPSPIHSAYLEAVVSTSKENKTKQNIENYSRNWYFPFLNDSEPVVRNTCYIKPRK